MAGAAQRAAQISSQCLRLEESHESVCHPVRGSVYTGQELTRAMELLNRLAHKITDTPNRLAHKITDTPRPVAPRTIAGNKTTCPILCQELLPATAKSM